MTSTWGNHRRTRLPRPTLPTIEEEDEDDHQVQAQKFDLHRELDAYAREDTRPMYEEDEEMMEWDEETTLVALFQDECVNPPHICTCVSPS